jgi:hypothetical protein
MFFIKIAFYDIYKHPFIKTRLNTLTFKLKTFKLKTFKLKTFKTQHILF